MIPFIKWTPSHSLHHVSQLDLSPGVCKPSYLYARPLPYVSTKEVEFILIRPQDWLPDLLGLVWELLGKGKALSLVSFTDEWFLPRYFHMLSLLLTVWGHTSTSKAILVAETCLFFKANVSVSSITSLLFVTTPYQTDHRLNMTRISGTKPHPGRNHSLTFEYLLSGTYPGCS